MTTRIASTALLPPGFPDMLLDEAEALHALTESMLAHIRSYGYRLVTPPMCEFEESFFAGPGESLRHRSFRLSDPQTHRMMALRSDMTPQIARIAATRLRHMRPLRLAYRGEVLRNAGSPTRPRRQFTQIGAELIGIDTEHAEIEIIRMSIEALKKINIDNVVVDLTLPSLPHALAALIDDDTLRDNFLTLLARRDFGSLQQLGERHHNLKQPIALAQHIATCQPKDEPPAALASAVKALWQRANTIEKALDKANLSCRMSFDPFETSGFAYHHAIAFAIYAHGGRAALGRGGRYLIPNANTEPPSTQAKKNPENTQSKSPPLASASPESAPPESPPPESAPPESILPESAQPESAPTESAMGVSFYSDSLAQFAKRSP